MKIYRIKCNIESEKEYVSKIINDGDHIQHSKNGKVWFSKKQAIKSLDWCNKIIKYGIERSFKKYTLETYELIQK